MEMNHLVSSLKYTTYVGINKFVKERKRDLGGVVRFGFFNLWGYFEAQEDQIRTRLNTFM